MPKPSSTSRNCSGGWAPDSLTRLVVGAGGVYKGCTLARSQTSNAHGGSYPMGSQKITSTGSCTVDNQSEDNVHGGYAVTDSATRSAKKLLLIWEKLKVSHVLDCLPIQNGISSWRVARAADFCRHWGMLFLPGTREKSVPSTRKEFRRSCKPKKNSAWDRTDDLWVYFQSHGHFSRGGWQTESRNRSYTYTKESENMTTPRLGRCVPYCIVCLPQPKDAGTAWALARGEDVNGPLPI